MRRRSGLFVAVLSAALVVSALPAAAGSGLGTHAFSKQLELTRRSSGFLQPAEILVKYRSSANAFVARARAHAELVKRLPGQALEVVKPEISLQDTIAALEADPNVVYAEPNYLYEANASITPNDPRYGQLWGMSKIRMPEAWGLTRGSKDVTVAVVDSGVALAHPDLASNIWSNPAETGGGKETNGIDDDGNGYVDDWRGWDWIDRDNRPNDAHGHGSHVAGTIGARGHDGFGIAGVNWEVGLLPLRTLDSTGVGTSGDIAAAFTYAGELGIDIVNASLGGNGPSTAILEAINSYPDTLFVVAAGNDGTNNDLQPQYPCNYSAANLICVAASDSSDNLAGFSNYGATSVDLAAPGVGIVSAAPATSQPFTENFESDISMRWTSGGINNLWTRGIDAQGGYLSESLGINYLDDTDSWIGNADPFTLEDQTDCKLHFTARLDLESGKDILLVEMSRNAQSWSKVGGWSGSSDGRWSTLTDDLHDFDGASSAYLRFRLRTNDSVTRQGADLDDVRVRCLSQTYSGSEFLSASGTSMAAPHVAGVAALLKTAAPEAGVAQIVAALVTSTKTTTGLTGRVATSGRLDAAAALEGLTGSALSQPEPIAGPADEPTPTATATPSPLPSPIEAATNERSLSLRLQGRFVSGRVNLVDPEGYAGCVSNVSIKIKRNGVTIKKLETSQGGLYSGWIPNKPGRYRAIAPGFDVPDALPAQSCARSRSVLKRR